MSNHRFNYKTIIVSALFLLMVGCSDLGTDVLPSVPLKGKIAFLVGDRLNDTHIYVMNADGSELTDITPPSLTSIGAISWSPDSQYVAFHATQDDKAQIFKMKVDGSDLIQLTFREEHSFSPSWSPDGKSIIFISADQNILDDRHIVSLQTVLAWQIYIMNADGSNIRRLLVEEKDENVTISGAYRKDGLIAVSEPVTRYAVTNYIVNANGEIQEQFPEFRSTSPIEWSPDGKYVLYSADRNNSDCSGFIIKEFADSDDFCLKIDEAITEQVSAADGASWSPDGNYIVFSSNLDGDTDLYVIKSDDTGLTQITNLPGNEGSAVWSTTP